MPLFLHEREAHDDLISVLDEFQRDGGELKLPHIVVHCFTGTSDEAAEYIQRGYYIGFTGTICKKERGAPLRDILQSNIVPLNRIMIEADAPFHGVCQRSEEQRARTCCRCGGTGCGVSWGFG